MHAWHHAPCRCQSLRPHLRGLQRARRLQSRRRRPWPSARGRRCTPGTRACWRALAERSSLLKRYAPAPEALRHDSVALLALQNRPSSATSLTWTRGGPLLSANTMPCMQLRALVLSSLPRQHNCDLQRCRRARAAGSPAAPRREQMRARCLAAQRVHTTWSAARWQRCRASGLAPPRMPLRQVLPSATLQALYAPSVVKLQHPL